MTFFKWSKTAALDASADSSINWAEGQSPSSVNDSARAMMAAAAKYRDDIAGAIVTAGTIPFYTLTSNQGFTNAAAMNGMVIAFSPHATNNGPSQINVDGVGSAFLRTSPGVDLQAGMLIQGTPYVATYSSADNSFYLQNFYGNPYNIPLAAGLPFFGSTAPNSSFAFPFGQAVSRTTYAALFTLLSTTYGAGDGSTTFNIPDLRGRVPAGADNMGGSAASRLSGYTLSVVGGGQTQGIAQTHLPNVNFPITEPNSGQGHRHVLHADVTGSGANLTSPQAGGSGVGVPQNPTDFATTGITVNSGGSGTALPIVQPTMAVNYIMRII
jgi:microcystin-dependent protein